MEAHSGDLLLDTLCSCAPLVLFSAAIPGPGGPLARQRAVAPILGEALRSPRVPLLRALRWLFWEDEHVESWYRQNLLFATSDPDRYPTLFGNATAHPWSVVHPITLGRVRRPQMAEKPLVRTAG